MELISIYDYRESRQFLMDSLRNLKKSKPEFSLRSFSGAAGISHTLLVMLMQGKRPLRVKHASALATGLELSSQEKLYLQALIQLNSATDPEERELCSLWLSELHPERKFHVREIDEFWVISHWIHMAIYAMTDLADFRDKALTAREIAARMRFPVEITEIEAAIERMIGLGLLKETPDGKLRSVYQEISTPDDVASEGAKRYHNQAIELARQALKKDPPAKREYQSFSLAVDAAKLSLAKKKIRKFRSGFIQEFASESGSEVYQLNLQFFQLTERPSEMAPREDEGVDAESSFSRKKAPFPRVPRAG